MMAALTNNIQSKAFPLGASSPSENALASVRYKLVSCALFPKL
jgi:hypothetical protein